MAICYNCFNTIADGSGPCPRCGYVPGNAMEEYPAALPPGSVLGGRYTVGRVLGQGGFGITYVAQDRKTGEKVAIKEYFPNSVASRKGETLQVTHSSIDQREAYEAGRESFIEEAQVLAKFNNCPNIVKIINCFRENGTAYFSMEYIDGMSLKTHLKNNGGKIPWEEAVKLLWPVMDALEAVHSAGLVHRDVAPDNIYITNDGRVKLLDFGSARYSVGDQTRTLDVILKHGYAPIEQYVRRGRQGPYTDVYALAACFYAAITGYIPPDAPARVEEECLIPPGSRGVHIPRYLEDAILKGLSVQAVNRFQSMAEFRNAIKAPIPPVPPLPPKPPKWLINLRLPKLPIDRKKLAIIAGAACLAAVIAIVPVKVYKFIKDSDITETISRNDGDIAVSGKSGDKPVIPDDDDSKEKKPEKSTTKLSIPAKPKNVTLSIASGYIVGINSNGTAVNTSVKNSSYNVSDWSDIVSVAAGHLQIAGLKKDGTVVTAGNKIRAVDDWTDIAAIASGYDHVVGLKKDGTVVTTGNKRTVDDWTDIAAVAAGHDYTVGLKADGTVVAVGDNDYGQLDVSDWSGIIAIAAGKRQTVGLKADGTVVAVGDNDDGQLNVSDWTDIVAVAAGYDHTVGLKKDGTVIAAGDNDYGQLDVSYWSGIVAIAAGARVTAGLRSDGTVVTTNNYKADEISDWRLMVPEK